MDSGSLKRQPESAKLGLASSLPKLPTNELTKALNTSATTSGLPDMKPPPLDLKRYESVASTYKSPLRRIKVENIPLKKHSSINDDIDPNIKSRNLLDYTIGALANYNRKRLTMIRNEDKQLSKKITIVSKSRFSL